MDGEGERRYDSAEAMRGLHGTMCSMAGVQRLLPLASNKCETAMNLEQKLVFMDFYPCQLHEFGSGCAQGNRDSLDADQRHVVFAALDAAHV